MAMTDPLILPADVTVVPVAQLPADLRAQIGCDEGDYTLTRPRGRAGSRIVDAETVALLQAFRSPTTVVDAVLGYSQARALDPDQTLEEAYPLVEQLLKAQILVEADSPAARPIDPLLAIGETLLGYEVRRVLQVLEDTELYLLQNEAGARAALKILRSEGQTELRRTYAREAAVLRHLDQTVSPPLLGEGRYQGRPYLLIGWCAGRLVPELALELRRDGSAAGRMRLLELCCRLAEAYAHLHSQGVLHGDVHPGNVLVADDGTVALVDYGLARLKKSAHGFTEPQRGAVPYYYEPECARARLSGSKPPRVSAQSEQYALAVMLYHLLTGAYYVNFKLEKREMLRQIAEEPPQPFERLCIAPWPELEAILAQALSKQPDQRYGSIAELVERLRAVAPPADAWPQAAAAQVPADAAALPLLIAPTPRLAERDGPAPERLLEDVLARVAADGPLLAGELEPPRCSVTYGAAGVAYMLYRLAGLHNDAGMLSLADLWSVRALRNPEDYHSFYSSTIEINPKTVGRISLYHTVSGAHCVQGLISAARSDMVTLTESLAAFIAASQGPCESLDLTLGRASTLLGCTFLRDALPTNHADIDMIDQAALLACGERVLEEIWQVLDSYAPLKRYPELRFLGVAHGWAGLLYATLCWCRSARRRLPPQLCERLEQLAECAEPLGRGMRWKRRLTRRVGEQPEDYGPSWCNGTAGMVFLWTLAHDMLGEPRYLTLAEQAAWNAWEDSQIWPSLCCGLAGRAYALLNLYRHTGAAVWLARARELTRRAAAATSLSTECRDSLYKGEIGVALLAAELARPELACMPLFEPEGWPVAPSA
jgi:serine/threonine-protein kinase